MWFEVCGMCQTGNFFLTVSERNDFHKKFQKSRSDYIS